MPSCSRTARASAIAPRGRATLAPRLRAMADRKASGRRASTKKSTRLPAASTTGLGLGLASPVGQEEPLGFPALAALADLRGPGRHDGSERPRAALVSQLNPAVQNFVDSVEPVCALGFVAERTARVYPLEIPSR